MGASRNFLRLRWVKYLVLILTFLCKPFQSQAAPSTFIIDCGHGGHDSGARGKRCKEKDITWQVGEKLGNLIKKTFKGAKVIYTRKGDVFVGLGKRARIANQYKGGIFISLHADDDPKNPRTKGAATYVMGTEAFWPTLNKVANLRKASVREAQRVALRENTVILKEVDQERKYEGFNPYSPESHILFSMYTGANLENSLMLAKFIQDTYKEETKICSKWVGMNKLLLLWKVVGAEAVVLHELGFLSNREDEKRLMSPEGQLEAAQVIVKALKKYRKARSLNSVKPRGKNRSTLVQQSRAKDVVVR